MYSWIGKPTKYLSKFFTSSQRLLISDSLKPASASDSPRSLFYERDPERIMSRADCEALFKRVVGLTTGGHTSITMRSTWTGNLRWARNRPTTSEEIQLSMPLL